MRAKRGERVPLAQPVRRDGRGEDRLGASMLGQELGMAAEPVAGAFDLDDDGVMQEAPDGGTASASRSACVNAPCR